MGGGAGVHGGEHGDGHVRRRRQAKRRGQEAVRAGRLGGSQGTTGRDHTGRVCVHITGSQRASVDHPHSVSRERRDGECVSLGTPIHSSALAF